PRLEGSVRGDANVSVGGANKVESKSVSSFADVEKAVRYEITRQKTMASRDIEVKSETRHWDDARKVTKESRTKEEEQDYRYFPEDRKSTRLNSSHVKISYAVFCLNKKKS